MEKFKQVSLIFIVYLMIAGLSSVSMANPFQRPQIKSPEISGGGTVTFRLEAPKAENVKLISSDIPNNWQGLDMSKNSEGKWEIALDTLVPGSYRYNFNVDGVPILDPVNLATSESNDVLWSLVHVPGADFMDRNNVAHGAVAEVNYYSKSLKRFRRMHVYTPPGYESGDAKYPVFYLLHGAFDSDDSWSTVGRAGYIIDNLIASGKSVPMIVVMPKGHVRSFSMGQQLPDADPFLKDFTDDIVPYIETAYRVKSGRDNCAIAGLSMGGWHTLNLFAIQMEKYGYVGVYSSGIFGLMRQEENNTNQSWEQQHSQLLSDDSLKKGLHLFWFATGKEDFLIETSNKTVELFRDYGFKLYYKQTEGAHTWENWRKYLNQFTPMLFKPVSPENADNSPK